MVGCRGASKPNRGTSDLRSPSPHFLMSIALSLLVCGPFGTLKFAFEFLDTLVAIKQEEARRCHGHDSTQGCRDDHASKIDDRCLAEEKQRSR